MAFDSRIGNRPEPRPEEYSTSHQSSAIDDHKESSRVVIEPCYINDNNREKWKELNVEWLQSGKGAELPAGWSKKAIPRMFHDQHWFYILNAEQTPVAQVRSKQSFGPMMIIHM